MAIKEIVVHQGPDSRSETRLGMAAALAKAHDARLIGVFVKFDPGDPEFSWVAFSKEAIAAWLANLEKVSGEAEEAFKTRLAEEGLEGEWRLMEGNVTDAVMACARYGDLTVIGQTNPDEPAYGGSMPDQMVLGAGGPVIVVPYVGNFETVGKRVMVAWSGEREAARAVRDAMPILKQAESVMVYSINPRDEAHLAGAEICAHLARHGVRAEASHDKSGPEAEAVSPALKTVGGFGFQQRGPWTQSQHPAIGEIDVGDALLSAVSTYGIDLLVMGAYGHSRIRELVLGGATREVLRSMTVPVMMSS
jgi:nucleotide-binding universal stress UspA family protein